MTISSSFKNYKCDCDLSTNMICHRKRKTSTKQKRRNKKHRKNHQHERNDSTITTTTTEVSIEKDDEVCNSFMASSNVNLQKLYSHPRNDSNKNTISTNNNNSNPSQSMKNNRPTLVQILQSSPMIHPSFPILLFHEFISQIQSSILPNSNPNNIQSIDPKSIDILKRTIIIPISPKLIQKCFYHQSCNDDVSLTAAPKAQISNLSHNSNNNKTLPTINIYKLKSSSQLGIHKPFNTKSIPTSCLIDGVIQTLVQIRTRMERMASSSSPLIDSQRSHGHKHKRFVNTTTTRINHQNKRRNLYHPSFQKKKKNYQHLNRYHPTSNRIHPSTTKTKTTISSSLSGRNVLSEGYYIGSDHHDVQRISTYYSNTHLPSYLYCSTPNSSVSFAKSSKLITDMHELLGDDTLRDVLLHSIILIPLEDDGSNINHHRDDCNDDDDDDDDGEKYQGLFSTSVGKNRMSTNQNEWRTDKGVKRKDADKHVEVGDKSLSLFRHGNYFQFCGPPLHHCETSRFLLAGVSTIDESTSCTKSHCSSSVLGNSKNSRKNDINGVDRDDDNDYSIHPLEENTNKRTNNGITQGKKRKCTNTMHLETSSSKREKKGFQTTDISSMRSMNYKLSTQKKTSKTSSIWDANELIPHHKIFYADSYIRRIGFPPSHILNRLCEQSQNTMKHESPEKLLLDDILHLSYPSFNSLSTKVRRKRWKRVRTSGMDMCRNILRQYKKCDFARLLNRYCPILSENNAEDPQLSVSELIANRTDHAKVISFIIAVLKRVFPSLFWGSEHNFQVFISTMSNFIHLRRGEKFAIKHIVHGIRVKDIRWLFSDNLIQSHDNVSIETDSLRRNRLQKSDFDAATTLMRNQMQWLYCNFIIPLIRASFYVTDTEFTAKKANFYRKPLWSKLKNSFVEDLIQKQYKEIPISEALARFSSNRISFSSLRLLPKLAGVRPIAMLCKKYNVKVDEATLRFLRSKYKQNNFSFIHNVINQCKPSANTTLKQAFDILKYEYNVSPERFSSGLLGINGIWPKLRDFLKEVNRSNPDIHGRKLFFASVDIRRCFDNVDQQYLFELLKNIISEEEYLIQYYTILHSLQSEKKSLKRLNCVGTPSNMTKLQWLSSDLAVKFHDSIIIDDVKCNIACREHILSLIHEHLSSNVVVVNRRIHPQYLLQVNGIPQGSILSTMLCNYYYGDIEKTLICHDSSDKHHFLLLRVVDDFLFCTTSREASKHFIEDMYLGNPQLGVQMNTDKSKVCTEMNMQTEKDNIHIESCIVHIGERTYFPWCGMLFDTETCSVRVDYSRFADDQTMNSLLVDRSGNSGVRFLSMMKSFVKPRLQRLLFDKTINTNHNMIINFYQVIAFCAVKSILYIKEGLSVSHNLEFILGCIEKVILYTFNYVKNVNDDHTLRKDDALWLGNHAFISVLQCFKSKEHFDLIKSLKGDQSTQLKTKSISCQITHIAVEALEEFNLAQFTCNKLLAHL